MRRSGGIFSFPGTFLIFIVSGPSFTLKSLRVDLTWEDKHLVLGTHPFIGVLGVIWSKYLVHHEVLSTVICPKKNTEVSRLMRNKQVKTEVSHHIQLLFAKTIGIASIKKKYWRVKTEGRVVSAPPKTSQTVSR